LIRKDLKPRFRKEPYPPLQIEIHGGGGKGVDWTEGCIALTNSEIDLVFSIAKVGTPVTIVGSIKDISQILDNQTIRNGN
jgi:hypothetical protein